MRHEEDDSPIPSRLVTGDPTPSVGFLVLIPIVLVALITFLS